MALGTAIARLGYLSIDLAISGINGLTNRRLPPPFHGMTLDFDDAAIAKSWLNKRAHWEDLTVISAWEAAFAKWNGSAHAIACGSGREALSACIYALGLDRDDEVIIPGYTCIVVQNAFDFAGVRTVHCDIELDTFGPSLASVVANVTQRTKAILVQHLYGLVCRDYESILNFARNRGLKVIEDCAQATGATFRGKRVGTYGDVAFYSSEWTKVFTTVVGGIAVTDDSRIAGKFVEFASNCKWPSVENVEIQLRTAILAYTRAKLSKQWWSLPFARFKYGRKETVGMSRSDISGRKPDVYGVRMSAPAADIAMNQLRKIDYYNKRRRETAKLWDAWCDENGFQKPVVISSSSPVYLRYPVLLQASKKMDTRWAHRELGIEVGVWFKTNLHPSPRIIDNCPNADVAVSGCINLPTLLND